MDIALKSVIYPLHISEVAAPMHRTVTNSCLGYKNTNARSSGSHTKMKIVERINNVAGRRE